VIKYLVFDFDGTIADSTEGILQTTRATFARMGLPRPDDADVRQGIGLPLKGALRTAGLPEDRLDEGADIYHEVFYEVAPKHIVLFPGIKEALEKLASRGYRMAIATSRSEHSLVMLLGEHGIAQYFEVLGSVGCVDNPKPAPDIVLWVLGRMGATPDQSLVIGDTVYDIQMGKAARCSTCAVTYGNHGPEQLRTAEPDFLIDDMRELARLLKDN
jgi:phosphoglycolate phosphatase